MLLGKTGAEAPRVRDFYVSFLKASAVGWGMFAGLAMPAQAADECGAAVAGTVTCTAAGNPYATGITYIGVGDIAVTTNADVAAANTLRVTGSGVTSINNGGTVTTALNNQPGIFASGLSASVNSTGTVTTAGAAGGAGVDGIAVTGTTGTATATVRNITVTGTVSGLSRPRGLVVTAATAASATFNGAVNSTNGDGAVIAGVTATANVAVSASVIGGVNGLVLTGTAGEAGSSSVSLTNAGTIRGGATGAAVSVTAGPVAASQGLGLGVVVNSGTIGSGSNLAVQINRGAANITNSGTINGRINTAYANDTVTNYGVFNAFSNSDFGDGNDTFSNSGTLNLLPAGSAASTLEFTALETFNNSGTINFANGAAFNTFTLPGTYMGSGASSLVFDVVLGAAPASDLLVVNGAAVGSTAVVLGGVNPTNASVNAGLVLATGGAGSSATAFFVAAQSQDIGFINFLVSPTTTAGVTTYSLVGTPGDSVVRALKINEGAQNIWHQSADAWAAHSADLRTARWGRDPDERQGGAIWLIAHGGVETRHDSKTSTAFGFSRNVDASYQQDSFGFQLGADLGRLSGLVFGITAGYGNSRLKSLSSADRTQFETVNGGVYANFVSGKMFVNVLAKYDRIWIDSQSPVASFSARYDGKSYGVQGELGLQLGNERFFVEPSVSAAFVRTDLDSPAVANATLDFDELDGVRGKAGLRVGTSFDVGSSGRGVAYLSGHAVHEFEGREGLRFVSNGALFTYSNNQIGTYAEGKVGVNIVTSRALSGFIEGFGRVGEEYSAVGARAGLRISL